MTDSAILARLIYRSYAAGEAPVPSGAMFVSFCDSLELYAKTRIRELIEDGKLELVSESDAAPPAAAEAPPAPEPAPKTDRPPEGARYEDAAQPADTHTHTHTHTHQRTP